MLKMRSLVNAVAMTVLAIAGVFSAHAGTMVNITFPIPGTAVQGTATATIHLTAPADPSTLKVQENGVDITQEFNVSSCSAPPCDVSATLTTSNGQIISGWNYLYATVQTAQGIADFANLKFMHVVGLTDSSDGSGPPYAVHIWTQPINGTGGAVLFNLSYSPGAGNAGTQYPNGLSQVCGDVEIFILNRGVQQPQDSSPAPLSLADFKCVTRGDNTTLQSILKSVTVDQIVLAAALPGTSVAGMDFSSVGGYNFTPQYVAQCAFQNAIGQPCLTEEPYNYTLIGYGQSSSGVAYEDYTQTAQDPWPAVDGNLVNTAPNGTVYAFQPTRTQGFTIVPSSVNATGKSQIIIGNMSDPGLAGIQTPNQIVPSGIGLSTTYTAPATSQDGLWLLVLDRHSLKSTLSQVYNTGANTDPATFCAQATALTNDIRAQTGSSLVFLSTVGQQAIGNFEGFCNNTRQSLMDSMLSLGVSPHVLNRLEPDSFGTNAGGTLSLAGIPGGLARNSTAIGSYQPTHSWWSSTRESLPETGALRGVLALDHTLQYQPTDVGPFDPSTVGKDKVPTTDELLNQTASYTIASAPIVSWPLMDTPGHLAAYAYLSNYIITKAFYGTGSCPSSAVCNDIRFYYTGSQVDSLTNLVSTVSALLNNPVGGDGFSSSDFTAVCKQLVNELTYLESVRNYQNQMEQINTDQRNNVGLALSTAANQVESELNSAATFTPPVPTTVSKIQLTADVLNSVAGLASSLAPFEGVGEGSVSRIAVFSGVMWSGAGFLQTFNDFTNYITPQTTPSVLQLSDLLSQGSGYASQDAIAFNNSLINASGVFFDGVYSDWYKLQALGLLVVSNPAWYSQDAGVAEEGGTYLQTVTEGETANLLEQILAQDVSNIGMTQVSTIWYENNRGYAQSDVDAIVETYLDEALVAAVFINDTSSFGRRTSLGWGNCQDYTFPSIGHTGKIWSSSLWNMLVGTPTGPDDTQHLGLSADLIYDMVLPSSFTTLFPATGPDAAPKSECFAGLSASNQYPTSTSLETSMTSAGTDQNVDLTVIIKSLAAGATGDISGLLLIRSNDHTVATVQVPAGSGTSVTVSYSLAASALSSGANNLTADFSGNDSYQASSGSASISVGAPSFALTAEAGVLDLLGAPGSTISTGVTLTPDFGFNAAVQLSCSGLPAYIACSFDESQLTVSGAPTSARVTFTNKNTAQAALDTKQIPGRGLGILACGLVSLGFIRRGSRLVMLIGLVVVGSFLGGCGTSPSVQNPPAGSYVVTLNATGGGITQSSKVTLNIQ